MARPRLLVLPGIGDIYWVATFLRSYIQERLGGETPELHIWTLDDRPRSLGYIERLPGVVAGTYHKAPLSAAKDIFDEAYFRAGRWDVPGLFGFDHLLSVNGWLRAGKSIADAVKPLAVDWHFPLRKTVAEIAAEEAYRKRWPNGVILGHFSDLGMFQAWVKAWPAPSCARFVKEVARLTGLPVVLTGGWWDKPFSDDVARTGGVENLAGATDLDQFFALLSVASGFVGWCGGNTILAASRHKPAAIGWSTYFPHDGFYRYSVAPDAGHYLPFVVERERDPIAVAERYAQMFNRSRKG